MIMKYKITGLVLCIAVIAAGLILPAMVKDDSYRYHQHIEDGQPVVCEHDGGEFCTHLPLVLIETGGEEIPGRTIIDIDGSHNGYTTTADGSDELRVKFAVVDNEGFCNRTGDAPDVFSDAMINVRGRSSRSYDKSSYAVRLITENGENNKLPVMGMDAHHEWALHGPYRDKSLIRNYLCMNLAGEIMDYAPNVRFCEVMIDGVYDGLYVMMETITAGDDGARLSLTVNESNNNYTGYVVEIDGNKHTFDLVPRFYSDEDEEEERVRQFAETHPDVNMEKVLIPLSAYSHRTDFTFKYIYPGERHLTDELKEAIEQDLSDFQKVVYSYDYDNHRYGSAEYMDMQSFIDFFLINEFTCNFDAGWLSTYIYKDIDGKFRTCVWDFNSACDNYDESYMINQMFDMHTSTHYHMFFKDEDFVEALIDRYWYLREEYLNEEYLLNYIDDVVEYLGPAIDRNYQRWGNMFTGENDFLNPAERNPGSYAEAIEQLKNFFPERIDWMDKNIASLRQHCAESKVKKFNENAN